MMDYIGKKVFHKAQYGNGIIVSQSASGTIGVKFESEPELRRFIAPDCFRNFLKLQDEDLEAKITEELRLTEKAVKEKKEKEEENAKRRAFSKKLKNLPESVDEFCEIQKALLQNEMIYLRGNGGKRQKLFDGKLVESTRSKNIYSFESETELSLPDNTLVTLWVSEDDKHAATVVNCEDFTIIIACSAYLGEEIRMIEFSAEPWRLLQFLIDRLEEIRSSPSPLVEALVCDGPQNVSFKDSLALGQDTAVEMSRSQPITFIWGPPGTGKTTTLAGMAREHIRRGARVLMLSYSNISVDGAAWKVFELDKKTGEAEPGRLVRYGYPKDKDILSHPYLTAYSLALLNHPELLEERKKLIRERKLLSRSTARYVEIGKRLTRIRDELKEEEQRAVGLTVIRNESKLYHL